MVVVYGTNQWFRLTNFLVKTWFSSVRLTLLPTFPPLPGENAGMAAVNFFGRSWTPGESKESSPPESTGGPAPFVDDDDGEGAHLRCW